MKEPCMVIRPDSDKPLYEQIYSFIRDEIKNGKLLPGNKIPSTRALSRFLTVSRSTVELSYAQLISEGYIDSKPGSGYFVAEIDGICDIHFQKDVKTKEKAREPLWRFDLSPNGVDNTSFPYAAFRKISREILSTDNPDLFAMGEAFGDWTLRREISEYLRQARGVLAGPENIVVGAGNDYLLMLLRRVLCENRRVAFENPTYIQAKNILEGLGCTIKSVLPDASGIPLSGLRESGADMVYVMPSHQFPLGYVMPLKRRLALLSWAKEKKGRYIIEDDYDSEFRYRGKPIPALKAYDSAGKVIYLGTFSKSIAPSMRVSYMVLPENLVEPFHKENGYLNNTVSRLDQKIIEKFLSEGYYERHLNRMRALYKGRHDALLEALAPLKQRGYQVSGENAGVHMLLSSPKEKSEEELIERAMEKGIFLKGLSAYGTGEDTTPGRTVLIGYAHMEEKNIRQAVEILNQIW